MMKLDPSQQTRLMERCVERENMLKAWKRVKQNGGSAGTDGMNIEESGNYLKTHWSGIREELIKGTYKPKPVRKVEIEKPGGGVRQLGIPCVVDRLIQQCILQILQPQWDPTFHEHSYGFRPGRSAHQAICQAQQFIQEGRRWCVDVDLEKFFDRVNHDILMDRVAKRVKDERMVKLIRRYLQAGIMDQGVCTERHEGTPQGGPLSPLLSNLLLDEVDQELEKRNLAFVRYADDCNVYVRSERAAKDVMVTLEKLMGNLKLKINREKSAVDYAWKRKFLGYRFWMSVDRVVKKKVAPQALEKFKNKVRSLTNRNGGKSLEQVIENLDVYLVGWKSYFRLADTPKVFSELDSWIRRRLRVIQLKHWKRSKTAPVFITGESGTGKELIAKRLHEIEGSVNRVFVDQNCGAIPLNLVESTLFGHIKGAFTGAQQNQKGLLELANGGDLFLDEVTDLPLSAQVGLLRALQEGEIKPIGSERKIKTKFRVICATNKNVEELVAKGLFREDLYYRLAVIRIQTTPLRERVKDVPELAQFFAQLHKKSGRHFTVSNLALEFLSSQAWKGNVRELRNAIELAVINANYEKRDILFKEDFIQKDQPINNEPFSLAPKPIEPLSSDLLPKTMEEFNRSSFISYMDFAERSFYIAGLKFYNWDIPSFARAINIGDSTLYTALKRLNIQKPNIRRESKSLRLLPKYSKYTNQEIQS